MSQKVKTSESLETEFEADDKHWLVLFCDACDRAKKTNTGTQLSFILVGEQPNMPRKYTEVLLLSLLTEARQNILCFESGGPAECWEQLSIVFGSLHSILEDEAVKEYLHLLKSVKAADNLECKKLLLGMWQWVDHCQDAIMNATQQLFVRMSQLELKAKEGFPFV